jgi:hypothetical protein
MAALLLLSAWAYLGAADGTMAVARDPSLEPVVPMGALTMAPDTSGCDPGQVRIPPEDDCVQAYIPLLGYVWWFGPLGPALLIAAGLAIAFYAGRRLRPWTVVVVAVIAVAVMLAVVTWRLGTLQLDDMAGWGGCPLPPETCQLTTWSQAALVGLFLGGMVGGTFAIAALLGRRTARDPVRERRGPTTG